MSPVMSCFVPGSLSSQESVAIIGGGFSGTVLAVQLLRKSAGRLSVVLIERNPRFGRGVAYGTRCTGHLLNVPAKDMSAFPDDPGHFRRWARSHHSPDVKGSDFLPRGLYGDYVQSVLHREIDRFPRSFLHIQDEAVALDYRGGAVQLSLRTGQTHLADKVVLAPGNFPPADLPLTQSILSGPRYLRDPWAPEALQSIAPNDEVLLVGSGLTSVDILLALRASGHAGKIHFLSRHGLLPNGHRPTAPWPSLATERSPVTLLELMRKIRMEVIVACMRGYDWRAVIDAMRPVTQQLWRSLPLREQRRFLRHLRPYWEVHRHRIAPEIATRLEAEIAEGHAEIHTGRIAECEEAADGIEVTWRDRRSGNLQELRVQHIVNCTGPEMNCRRLESPLIASLLRCGLVREDRLSLGLDCADDGALVDAHGAISTVLYALGPARKGSLWESTAVPDIRVQACELAETLSSVRWKEKTSSEMSPILSPVNRRDSPENPFAVPGRALEVVS